MNWNDEPTSEGEGLGEKLAREAMAERPPFSAELTQRILDRLDREGSASPRSWRKWAIAAAAMLALSGVIWLMVYGAHEHPVIVKNIPRPPAGTMPMDLPSMDLSIDFSGVLSARLIPPEITVASPVTETAAADAPESQPDQSVTSSAVADSPQWLVAAITSPASSAQAALAEVMPPEIKDLLGLAGQ
jgi:hypothetical protein